MIKTTSIETLFIFIGSLFYFEIDHKKPPPLAMVHFLS
ncbi:hypothetical protein ECDEC6E_4665 [Escherichia coli DEC6E]|nr:hypothetical protein ECDEC6E_4665 [Escherichia coli DEC6E]